MNLHHFISLTVLFLSLSSVTADAGTKKELFRSPITVDIKMKKDTFRIGERVEGQIILKNAYPGSPPAAFYVKLFRDGTFFTEIKTSIPKVAVGTMKFTFKEFGIPHFNNQAGAQGEWKIVILQENVSESYQKEVIIHVVPPAFKEKKGVGFKKREVY